MGAGAVVIREATAHHDLEDWVAVKNRVAPLDRNTVEELEHERTTEPGSLLFVATMRGQLAGCGVAKPSQAMPDSLFAMARVLPEMRGRGVGSALYQTFSVHARQLARSHLYGRVQEADAESLAWVIGRGFAEIARESEFLLTLATVSDGPLPSPPEGIALISLALQPELAASAHRIESEVVVDIPGPFPQQPATYEAWAAESIKLPGFLAEGSFVALLNGEPVGYAGLNRKDATLAEHLLTGVRLRARRRGIATALKQAQIGWAKNAGYEQLVTWTSSRNDPMRAINVRLGYVEQPASIVVRGPIS